MKHDNALARFLEAQEPIYEDALAILRGGRMCSQYMEVIFPRLAGCYPDGDATFAIQSLDEARAYLVDGTLGGRYRECLAAMAWLSDQSVEEVFTPIDTCKLHASLTLFAEAADEDLLRQMLDIWFGSRVDEATVMHLDLVP